MSIIHIILFLSCWHPLHLGVVHLNIDEKGEAIVQIRLFTDDLENGIFHLSNKKNRIYPSNKKIEKKVNRYIDQNFKIKQEAQNVIIHLETLKQDKDITELKYTAKVNPQKKLEICCGVFFELFRDQTNLLIVNVNGKEEGHRLTPDKMCVNVQK